MLSGPCPCYASSMILQYFRNVTLVLCLLAPMAQAAARGSSVDDAVLAAYDAYHAGDPMKLARAAQALPKDYVLEPYVAYWTLSLRLEDASDADVQAFLDKYSGTYVAKLLRADWLKVLGKRADWTDFEKERASVPSPDLETACYGWLAHIARADIHLARAARSARRLQCARRPTRGARRDRRGRRLAARPGAVRERPDRRRETHAGLSAEEGVTQRVAPDAGGHAPAEAARASSPACADARRSRAARARRGAPRAQRRAGGRRCAAGRARFAARGAGPRLPLGSDRLPGGARARGRRARLVRRGGRLPA